MTGKEFKLKREELGLSQSDLAALMSVTRVTISRWENSNKIPKAQEQAIKQMYHNDTKKEIEENVTRPENQNELKAHFEKLLKKVNKTIDKLEKEDVVKIDALEELKGFILLKKEIQKELDAL